MISCWLVSRTLLLCVCMLASCMQANAPAGTQSIASFLQTPKKDTTRAIKRPSFFADRKMHDVIDF